MKPRTIYLDYAATTPIDKSVLKVMAPYWEQKFYNPSALYLSAKEVAKDLATARIGVAGWLGAKPTEIIFTAGATEANNLAIHGIMRQHPKSSLIVSEIEHESVIEPAKEYSYKVAPVTGAGLVDLAKLMNLIDDKTVMISLMYANNEIGTIQPLNEVSRLVRQNLIERRKKGNNLPLYIHTDAAQAAGYLDLHTARLGVDLMSINGSKIYGPKQTGALFIKTGTKIQPLILGGGQERGLRSGTENVSGYIGLAAALDLSQRQRLEESRRLQILRDHFIDELLKLSPDITINGSRRQRLPNNIHVTFPGYDNERLMMQLDENGIMCATGSACSAANSEPSHVLTALGLDDVSARSSLRFTLGRMTSLSDLEYTVNVIKQILQ